MILTDVHTHSTFSADGISPLRDMVKTAKRMGVFYYGVSEHFDYDYRAQHILINGKEIAYTDAAAYFSAARALQAQENDDTFQLLVGGEYGFCTDPTTCEQYAALSSQYRPDFVVNSVHTTDGYDCYFGDYFVDRDKRTAYSRYLDQVRLSLEAPYAYDIVAHIGYVSRNAPYPDPKLRYEDFADLYDDILCTVIAKDKILEINSSARTAGSAFLPDTDVLSRYYELGGRKVSFASDAHNTARICDKRDIVVSALKQIGFTHITVPICGRHIPIEL